MTRQQQKRYSQRSFRRDRAARIFPVYSTTSERLQAAPVPLIWMLLLRWAVAQVHLSMPKCHLFSSRLSSQLLNCSQTIPTFRFIKQYMKTHSRNIKRLLLRQMKWKRAGLQRKKGLSVRLILLSAKRLRFRPLLTARILISAPSFLPFPRGLMFQRW